MRKSLKQSKKDGKERKKRIANEAAGVSTSLTYLGGPRPLLLSTPTSVSENVGVLSTLTTVGLTISDT